MTSVLFFLALIITSDLVMDFFVLLVNFSWFLLPLLLFKPNVWFCSTTRRRRWTWYTWVNFGTANNETEHWTKMNWTDRRFELSKVVKLKAIQIHGYKMNSIVVFKVLSPKPVQNHHETQIRKSCFEMIQTIKIHMMQ